MRDIETEIQNGTVNRNQIKLSMHFQEWHKQPIFEQVLFPALRVTKCAFIVH